MPYTLENLKNFADIQTTISREDPRGTEYIGFDFEDHYVVNPWFDMEGEPITLKKSENLYGKDKVRKFLADSARCMDNVWKPIKFEKAPNGMFVLLSENYIGGETYFGVSFDDSSELFETKEDAKKEYNNILSKIQ